MLSLSVVLRAIFVLLIFIYGVGKSFRGPFYTLLLYLWIAYFRPETWMWDPSLYSTLKLSLITGIVLLISTVLSGARWRFDIRTLFLLLLFVQDGVSTFTSPYINWALRFWPDFVKCVTITYLITVLVDDRQKLRTVLWIIAMSAGVEAAKQGWAQFLLDPGGKNLNGVTVFGDENETAVGLFMLIPVFGALAATTAKRWEKYLIRFVALGVIYRAIVTYSRGGFLTAIAVAVAYFFRSRHKLRYLLTLTFMTAVILPILPEDFWGRMRTITVAPEQRNEMSEGRLYFWGLAVEMADTHPVFGVGHNSYLAAYNTYDRTHGQFGPSRSVHNSWLGMLADLGYPGLALYLVNLGLWLAASLRVGHLARRRPDLADLGAYASALGTSFIAFCVGGTFVSFEYNEALWHLTALSGALLAITLRAVAVEAPAAAPASAVTILPRLSGRPAIANARLSTPRPAPGRLTR